MEVSGSIVLIAGLKLISSNLPLRLVIKLSLVTLALLENLFLLSLVHDFPLLFRLPLKFHIILELLLLGFFLSSLLLLHLNPQLFLVLLPLQVFLRIVRLPALGDICALPAAILLLPTRRDLSGLIVDALRQVWASGLLCAMSLVEIITHLNLALKLLPVLFLLAALISF